MTMDFNAVYDQDVKCDSANSKDTECTGKIPAGEPHHHMKNASKGYTDLDWDDPRNAIRYCRNCVRRFNWDLDKNRKILVKVELTYSDGSKQILEDEAADDWGQQMGGATVMSFTHGVVIPQFPWKGISAPVRSGDREEDGLKKESCKAKFIVLKEGEMPPDIDREALEKRLAVTLDLTRAVRPSDMSQHDRTRMDLALSCDRNDVESVKDAIRALQSTDHPALGPLHDELQRRLLELEKGT